jgi:glycerophosphoryl diester phosphodiesterase
VASPLVIAHRGASAERPENTLAAFRRAIAVGADGIELDVQMTGNGVPVVFHDETLRRLTGAAGRLEARSWAELARLRVRGDEKIPRLSDALRLTRDRIVVQIELKGGVGVAPVVAVVNATRARDHVILASFSPTLVRTAARLAPAVPRMLISRGRIPAASLAQRLASVHAGGLSVDHRAVRSARWVRYFQVRGFAVWCWTVNDPVAMRRLARWGVNGILTDNPALLRRVV